MIRFILVCIVVIAYLVLTIPVLLVEWIIGKFSPMTKDISSLRMVQAIFKFRTGYVAKKEMEHYPLLSNWMRNLYCLFLDREDIKQGLKTILQAADYVKSGISVCIFPEGTRNKNADETEMLPFHDGSFKIAARAKSPIIPIAISNSANIWEANFPKMTPTHVVIEYGKPIIPSELDRDTQRRLGSYTQNIIKEMLIKNKELV